MESPCCLARGTRHLAHRRFWPRGVPLLWLALRQNDLALSRVLLDGGASIGQHPWHGEGDAEHDMPAAWGTPEWEAAGGPVLAEVHGIDVTVVDDTIDPRFSFMTLDKDGLIRMDCSNMDER